MDEFPTGQILPQGYMQPVQVVSFEPHFDSCNVQRSYGGEVIVAPSGVPADHHDHYQHMAVTLCKEHADYFDVDQYDNPNNPEAYYRSLGPEVNTPDPLPLACIVAWSLLMLSSI